MVIRVVFASGTTVRFRPPRDTLPLYLSLAFLVVLFFILIQCCSIFKAGLTFCFLFVCDRYEYPCAASEFHVVTWAWE